MVGVTLKASSVTDYTLSTPPGRLMVFAGLVSSGCGQLEVPEGFEEDVARLRELASEISTRAEEKWKEEIRESHASGA